jgi:hypothetical protein
VRCLIAVGLALMLAACAGPEGAGSPADAGSASSAATATVPSASPGPSPTPAPPVANLLPVELDGIEVHTFPVAQDLLARFAAAIEIAMDDLEVAYASEHGARFIQMLAVRAPNIPEGRMLEVLADAAYPPVAVDALEVGTDTLGGIEVVTVHNPELAPRLGTFYGLVRGGALIVVEALVREDAEVAVAALP